MIGSFRWAAVGNRLDFDIVAPKVPKVFTDNQLTSVNEFLIMRPVHQAEMPTGYTRKAILTYKLKPLILGPLVLLLLPPGIMPGWKT